MDATVRLFQTVGPENEKCAACMLQTTRTSRVGTVAYDALAQWQQSPLDVD